jgi:hypothetical protein
MDNGAEVKENMRLEVLEALEEAGAVLAPRDVKAVELAEGISDNARVVQWLRSRLPATMPDSSVVPELEVKEAAAKSAPSTSLPAESILLAP